MRPKDKPVSKLTEKVVSKVNNELMALGGLTDYHLKFITFFVTESLKLTNYRFELRYLETPKRFIIHVFTLDGNQEIWCKPKPADILDKMAVHLGIDAAWKIEFAKRN